MKNTIRLLALLLALIMSVAVFASCNKDDGAGEETNADTAAPSGDGAETEAPFTADTEGVIDLSEYTIIRPSETDDTKTITQFRTYLKDYCGVELTARADSSTDKGAKEILIGNTTREASVKAMRNLKQRDWSVTVDGNKIVLVAGNESSIVNATNWLVENALQKDNKYAKIGEGIVNRYQYPTSEIKMGDETVTSLTVAYLGNDNGAYVDTACILADNILDAAGMSVGLGFYNVESTLPQILVASPEYAADVMPEGISVGNMQYVVAKKDNTIFVLSDDEFGVEIGIQKIADALYAGEGGAVDIAAVCSNNPVDFTYGKTETDKLNLTNGAEYRIMSYNILRREGQSAYAVDRYDEAFNTIMYVNPDVIGFEEYCTGYTANLTPKLQAAGYTVLGDNIAAVQNDNGKQVKDGFPTKHNYTPVAFKTEKFDLIDHGWKRLIASDDPIQKGYGWTGYSITWAVLQDKETGDMFAFTAKHTLASSAEGAVEKRVEVAQDIITLVKENIISAYECPVFMTGDYNTTQNNDDYKVYENEKDFYDARYIAERGYSGLATSFGHDQTASGKVVIRGTEANAIDHTFVTGNARVLRHRAVLSTETVKSTDHYPMIMDVIIG